MSVSLIFSILLPILKKTWTYLLVLGIAFFVYYKIKNWFRAPNNDVRVETVVEVDSPNVIKVKTGLLGRRTKSLILYGIEVPEEQYEDAMDMVNSYVAKDDQVNTEQVGNYYKIWSRGVYINKELILAGNAKLNQNDDDLLDAQSDAQNNQRGIWWDYEKPWFPWWDKELQRLKLEIKQ